MLLQLLQRRNYVELNQHAYELEKISPFESQSKVLKV